MIAENLLTERLTRLLSLDSAGTLTWILRMKSTVSMNMQVVLGDATTCLDEVFPLEWSGQMTFVAPFCKELSRLLLDISTQRLSK